ncbi:TetR/AcrR family transcriptional regulator [Cellulosimicrobium cellulans]|uniref:TetR/AcrR family transcriptional regulator n=1 Tax=Cellulosimicrobium cellulans TaxID=1710 RepID=UPI0009F34866|nr:TetR/AcrR family transcriptional regulator [Cellulosimicrobium cellulans]
MQEPDAPRRRRSNEERTRATRGALVDAARELFVTKGYAATSTPQIAAAARVTRGALYHHFVDKQDLFRAVVEGEAAAVAAEIEARAAASPVDGPDGAQDARGQLVAGAAAYLDAMAVPGRTRLLLLDAPAVLGAAEADAVDARHARRTLRAGLQETLGDRASDDARLDALTLLLSAAFDRAALAAESARADVEAPEGEAPGDDGDSDGHGGPDAVRWAVRELIERVCAPPASR